MKKGVVIQLVALLAGLLAFCTMRWHKAADFSHGEGIALDAMPELGWLRSELKLTEAQFVKVRERHAAYRPQCTEMCRRISEAHAKIEGFAAAHRVITPEYRAALNEHAAIHVECQEAMLNHLYGTAATLNPEQSKRYLETMTLFIYEAMSYAEISETLGCSPKAAESRIYRARQLLKEKLKDLRQ